MPCLAEVLGQRACAIGVVTEALKMATETGNRGGTTVVVTLHGGSSRGGDRVTC